MRLLLGYKASHLREIRLPCFVSFKYDGWRAFWQGAEFFTRSAKTLPNRALRQLAAQYQVPPGWDGEVIVGGPCDPKTFDRTNTFCKTLGAPIPAVGVRFFVFDNALAHGGFLDRYSTVYAIPPFVEVVDQKLIEHYDDLEATEAEAVSLGYEGICARTIQGKYKHGRSTLNESYLVKLKRYIDEEVTIKRAEPRRHNANPAFVSETGYTKRSSHRENLVELNTLGALVVDWRGKELHVGTGWDYAEATRLWQLWLAGKLPGLRATIRFSPPTKDLPRQPSYKGIRYDL